jgi:hypothetical protein
MPATRERMSSSRLRARLQALVWASLAPLGACTGEPDLVAEGLVKAPLDAGGTPPVDGAVLDPCDLDNLLERAGIPPEGIIVAATCQLPISWLDSDAPVDVGEQDLRELLMNSGPITPSPDTLTGQLLCNGEFSGLWYYDNPFQPTTINLCPELCDFVRAAVSSRIEDLGCESGLATDGGLRDRPFPFPPRPPGDAGSDAALDGSTDASVDAAALADDAGT